MQFIIGFLSGVLGMLAGWAGLAALVIALAGPDRDGGIAMGAFFNIGPIGGFVGFIAGVLLFIKIGLVRKSPPSPGAAPADAASAPAPEPAPRIYSFALPQPRLHDACPAIQTSAWNGIAAGGNGCAHHR
jgi:hypothetical protein